MAYPSLEQYNEALQSPHLVLQDAELKQGTVRKTGLGLPLALCGGFALTYTLEVSGRKYALRCFHKESRELERRYQAIAARLRELRSPYFLDFQFNPCGIRVGSQLFPTVKMAWAKGSTLAEFLEANHANGAALHRLRGAFAALAAYLEGKRVAHGDIQPENLMVGSDGSTVQLIDYDGMYVESLRGSRATELGQVNFQHPQRSPDCFDAQLDRFSFITLDVALQGLIASPGLWSLSRSEPSAVVFRRNDFLDPASSTVFQAVAQLPLVKTHVENLARVSLAAFSAVPTLQDFLAGRGIPAQTLVAYPPRAVAYQPAYPVCNAADYDRVMQLVGNRIELIGLIVDVKYGKARNRRPYVFINFADWRGKAVKLAIWSDALERIRPQTPDSSWVGSWVSATGLVDPPYRGSVGEVAYTHLSITIAARGQIQPLSERDAKFRLMSVQGGTGSQPVARNAVVIERMSGRAATPARAAPTSPPSSASGNRQVLAQMQRKFPPAPVAAPPPTAPIPPPSRPTAPMHGSPQAPTTNSGCLPVVLIVTGLLLLLRFLG